MEYNRALIISSSPQVNDMIGPKQFGEGNLEFLWALPSQQDL